MRETLPRIIYDFGANIGNNIPYYLKKADIVVAVEANPALTEKIEKRFAKEIQSGALFVENCVLTIDEESAGVPFYIHKRKHTLSQLPKPSEEKLSYFLLTLLPAKNVCSLIRAYGKPYYIKIDVEHYDQFILKALFSSGIRPPFISAESQTAEIFLLLVTAGGYTSLNLVDGSNVARKYASCTIQTVKGEETLSFPHHSAGPFGEDIHSPWMTPNDFLAFLELEDLGWKDIHGSSVIAPSGLVEPSSLYVVRKTLAKKVFQLKKRSPWFIQPALNRLARCLNAHF